MNSTSSNSTSKGVSPTLDRSEAQPAPPQLHANEAIPVIKTHDDNKVIAPKGVIEGSSHDSTDAIESATPTPGLTSSRIVRKCLTPSGLKSVIYMTDTDKLVSKTHDYIMSAQPPEWCYAWGESTKTGPSSNMVYTGHISDRIRVQMANFSHYSALGLWKIVAPIALFQSQRFWVSYKPKGSLGTGLDNLGFEWNPSEESELYVMTPWTGTTRTRVVSGRDSPDNLIITPITEIVYGEGNETAINPTVYYTPFDLRLYTPRPVSSSQVVPTPLVVSYTDNGVKQILAYNNCYFATRSLAIRPPSDLSPHFSLKLTHQTEPSTSYTVEALAGVNGDNSVGMEVQGLAQPLTPGVWELELTDFMAAELNQVDYMFTNASSITNYEYEMKYDNDNNAAKDDFGEIGNHTARLDTHWGLVESLPITSTSDVLLFNMATANDTYILQDMQRHLLFSKFPTVQFRSTSIPTANLLLRITQLPVTLDTVPLPLSQVLQLPGYEYNIKTGDLKLQPYWNSKYTASETPFPASGEVSLRYQVNVLGGSMSTDPVHISCLINPAAIEYFHLKGLKSSTRHNYVYQMLHEQDSTSVTTNTYERTSQDPFVESNSNVVSVDGESAGVVDSEKRWQYVTSFQIQPTTGAVSVRLDRNILGPHFWEHLRRYSLWRGRPRVKVMFTNARYISGNIHIAQTSSAVDQVSETFANWLRNIGYSTVSASDPATQIDLKWRNPQTYFRVGEDSDIGYLTVIVPEISAPVGSGLQQNLVCTIHVDTSSMELKCPTAPSTLTWTEPAITSMVRPTQRVV